MRRLLFYVINVIPPMKTAVPGTTVAIITLVIGTVIIVLTVLFVPNRKKKSLLTKFFKSALDGREYEAKDSRGADIIGLINHRNTVLIPKLLSVTKGTAYGPPMRRLAKRYDPAKIFEVCPFNTDNDTAYILQGGMSNGAEYGICIRDRNGKIFDTNTLMFVNMHELAHYPLDHTKHTTDFIELFVLIMIVAVAYGLYEPIDYSAHPVLYCDRVNITHNPLFEKKYSYLVNSIKRP
jgi:hypothetical protein